MDDKTNKHQENMPRTPAAFFWYVSKPFKKWFVIAFLLVILASGIGMGSAYIFKLFVEAIESDNYQWTIYLTLAYPVIILVEQLLYRMGGLSVRNWTLNAEKRTIDSLTDYTMKHSHAYFSDRFAGSVMSKIGNVAKAINTLIPEIIWTFTAAAVSIAITLVFLVLIDTNSALVFVAVLLILILVNKKLTPQSAVYSRQASEARTAVRGRVVDIISNIQAVRQYSCWSGENQGVDESTSRVKTVAYQNWGYREKIMLINGVLISVFIFIIFSLLIMGWRQGQVSTGDLILMIVLFSQITGTLIVIGRAFNTLSQTVGEMREGLDDLLIDLEITDSETSTPLDVTESSIDWKEVSFKFEGQPVFDKFNLSISAGQKVGLVGHSGAGKSTFVSLLLRQHDTDSGVIEISKKDISEVSQDSVRKAIAVVPQEPMLFHRSIRENIAYGKPNATNQEIIDVAVKAEAHDFIVSLPKGYDTLVGERGVKLSGGQKQRVAIARAMLKDAPILVLDEATSALDSESEVAIQKALHELMESKTVIAIAHRLSTLREMDRIIVLENGKIIEDGNHESLKAGGGVYEKLWNHQAGGFLVD